MGARIKIYDSNGKLIRGISQWDINREITVRGLSLTAAPIVRVWNAESETATTIEATLSESDVKFVIPNELAQVAIDIRVSIVLNNDTEYMTICRFCIPVAAQTKPDDYDELVGADDEVNPNENDG